MSQFYEHFPQVEDEEVVQQAIGVVLFAHGSGSSRRSPRNRFVAGKLREARLAMLLMELHLRNNNEQT